MNSEALRRWFDGLAPRERWLVLAAAAFAGFAIVFAIGVRPLLAARDRATQQVADQRSLLRDIEASARRFGPLTNQAMSPVSGGESLVVLVDRTTRERGLGSYLKRNQPEGPGGVRIRLENVPFDLLLEWLSGVQAQYGLAATSASFDPTGESGRVNGNLVMTRTGR